MFRIGQTVVCVKEGEWQTVGGSPNHGDYRPRKGEVCTVRGRSTIDSSFLSIEESGPRTFFHQSRFRPVVEKKTDISVFTEILRRETIDGSPVVTAPRTRKVSERSERIVP